MGVAYYTTPTNRNGIWEMYRTGDFPPMSGGFRKSICAGRNQKGMSRLNEKLKFRVSPEDVERIKVKMEDAGIMSMSAYIRKMALDGICVRMDLGDVRQLVILLRRCSNNLEQYARKANETGSVYAAEIANLQNRLDEIWELTRQSLARLAAIR